MARSKKQAVRADGRTNRGTFAPGKSGNPSGLKKQQPHHRADGDAELEKLYDRYDGWASSITGIGHSSYDKRLSHKFTSDLITYRDAMELWRGDDIAARAIETIPSECFRKGYEIVIGDEQNHKDLKEQLEKRLEVLRVNEKIERAYKFERAYGGGALLLGINDGQSMDQPVDLDRVTSLDYITPLEPIEIYPVYYYDDPTKPKYNEPRLYRLNAMTKGPGMGGTDGERTLPGQQTLIHESRLVVFEGIKVSEFQPGTSGAGGNWGDSTLMRFAGVLRDFNLAWQSAGIIVVDFSQSVFTMENLVQLMAANKQEQIAGRLRLIELARSTARAVLIDKNETYQRQTTSLAGLPDLLDRLSKRLGAAVDMPLTLLMGVATTGGSEGESDIRFFYDRVAAIQTRRIKPVLLKILQILIRSLAKKEPKKWGVEFHPLWQPTDKEAADARSTQANSDQIYIMNGVLTAEEVRRSRFGGKYSFDTQIDESIDEIVPPGQQGAEGAPDPEAMAAMGRGPDGSPLGSPGAGAGLGDDVAGEAMTPGATPAGIEPAKTALNGAQVTAMLEVIKAVALKEIPRTSAINMLASAFPITAQAAAAMVPEDSFQAPKEEPAPGPFGGGGFPRPQVPAKKPVAKADYDEDQPRAENGQWGEGGGGAKPSKRHAKASGKSPDEVDREITGAGRTQREPHAAAKPGKGLEALSKRVGSSYQAVDAAELVDRADDDAETLAWRKRMRLSVKRDELLAMRDEVLANIADLKARRAVLVLRRDALLEVAGAR